MADKIFAVDHVDHNPSRKSGVENIKRSVNDWHAAFPDTRNSVEDVIAEGDKVAVRWTTRATHKESSWASSRPAICYGNGGIGIFRFLGGKIVESWDEYEPWACYDSWVPTARRSRPGSNPRKSASGWPF